MGENSLRKRVVKGGIWVFSNHMLSQIIRFGSNLILTRLLVPEMFGLMAIVTAMLVAFTMLSDMGVRQSITQSKRGEDPSFLNTAWTVQIIKGIVLCYGMILLSHLFTAMAGTWGLFDQNSVYGHPMLPEVMSVMSLILLVDGFMSTKLYVKNRKIELGLISILEVTTQLLGILIVISIAWYHQTIWALVAGTLISRVVMVSLSHLVLDGMNNRIHWHRHSFHELFHFGKWMTLTSIIGLFLRQGDKFILASLISAAQLGVYSIAFFLSQAVQMVIEKVARSVLFPAYSEIARNDPKVLSRTYYRSRKQIDIFSFFVAGFLFCAGSSLIDFLYDDRYIDAGWMLETLSLSLLFFPYMLIGQCFIALGKPKYVSIFSLIHVFTLFTMLPLAYMQYGLIGAIWAITLSPIPRIIVTMYMMQRHHLLNIVKEFIFIPVLGIGYLAGIIFNKGISPWI